MTLKIQAKERLLASQAPKLVATEEPVDPIDTSDPESGAGAAPNPNAFFAGADSDSVIALEEAREQAQKVVDETTRALELHAMRQLLANDTSDFEDLPVANEADMTSGKAAAQAADRVPTNYQAPPSSQMSPGPGSEPDLRTVNLPPEGNMTMNAAFFTKDEARAAFAAFKAQEETKAGRSLSIAELIAIDKANQELDASFADDVSSGDAFDMLIDGDPSQEEPVVQELTNNDGGTEEPSDQPLLMNDLPPGPDSI